MSEGLTLDDLAVSLRALRLLAVDFGHLAAPSVHVGPIYPDRLDLSFHDDLAGFEAWREALGIASDAVTHGTQSNGHTRVLTATTDFAGAVVQLTGFAKVPAPALARAAA
ncbi:hypothetical protein [Streptomyces sp. YU58]|uniref:hypothetical protein n=1 Tax=Streptomyces sp. SX92 TaxID=3158972 RepID=UPI0027B8F722|nr:hypothetical protein [Streptomyces coralus]WLW53232.1 hypothetical protein QU709_18410 [Streptomyces coralus]